MSRQGSPTDTSAVSGSSDTHSLAQHKTPIRRLLHGSAWSVAQNVVRTAVSLVSVPLTVGKLGTERYGLWMLGLSVASLMSSMDAGLSPLLMNRLAESHARNDKNAFDRYVRAATTLCCGLMILSILASVLVGALDWPHIANVHEGLAARESRPLMVVVILAGMLGISLTPLENVLSARLDIVFPRVCSFVASLASFGLLLLGLWLNVSLPVLAGMVGVPLSGYRLFLIPRVLRTAGSRNLIPDWHEFRQVLRELLPSSVWFMLIGGACAASGFIPNVLAARYFGLGAVSVLSISMRLVSLPVSVLAAVLPNFWPAFTVAWHRGDITGLRRMLGWACGLTALALGLSCAVITIIGPWFVVAWTRGRIQVGAGLLFVLGCWAISQGILNWFSTFLHSITDLRFEAVTWIGTALLVGIVLRLVAPAGSMVLFCLVISGTSIFVGTIPLALRVLWWLRTGYRHETHDMGPTGS